MFYTTTINVIPDDGPVRSKICRLMFLKYYCELNYKCVHSLVEIVGFGTVIDWKPLSKTQILVYFYKHLNSLHSERSEVRMCFTAIAFHFDLEGARRK